MKRALITGSFDPPTKGHLDIIKRSAELFDSVTVCIFVNSEKRYMFSLATREEMLKAMCKGISNVRIDTCDTLVASYINENGIDVVVKGARNGSDFEYEAMLARVNSGMCSAETVILPARAELAHMSSTAAREMIKYSCNLDEYLTPEVIAIIENN